MAALGGAPASEWKGRGVGPGGGRRHPTNPTPTGADQPPAGGRRCRRGQGARRCLCCAHRRAPPSLLLPFLSPSLPPSTLPPHRVAPAVMPPWHHVPALWRASRGTTYQVQPRPPPPPTHPAGGVSAGQATRGWRGAGGRGAATAGSRSRRAPPAQCHLSIEALGRALGAWSSYSSVHKYTVHKLREGAGGHGGAPRVMGGGSGGVVVDVG